MVYIAEAAGFICCPYFPSEETYMFRSRTCSSQSAVTHCFESQSAMGSPDADTSVSIVLERRRDSLVIPRARDARSRDGNGVDAGYKHLSRGPTIIFNEKWVIGSGAHWRVYPWWELLVMDPHIANRLAGYDNLTADLRLKVIVDGGTNTHGAMRIAYMPNAASDSFTNARLHPTVGGMTDADLIGLSNYPGITISACGSGSYDISIPFHGDVNGIKISNLTSTTAEEMGTLVLKSMTPLRHINGIVPGSIGITIMGWLENVELTTPVEADQPAFVAQSAVQDISDVTPEIIGVKEDDMDLIANMAKKESYLTSFEWDSSQNTNRRLFAASVSPMTFATKTSGSRTEFHFTNMAFAALPFRYWRGTINYRFEIVATKHHTGRLKISHVRDDRTSTTMLMNSHIIEIGDVHDFTISVRDTCPFGAYQTPHWQSTGMYKVSGIGSSTANEAGTPYYIDSGHNGTILVTNMTPLTSPMADVISNITVNVYVSASDDFRVYRFNDIQLQQASLFVPSPAFTAQSAIQHVAQSRQEDQTDGIITDVMAPSFDPPPQKKGDIDYIGAPTLRWSDLLNRYALHNTWTVPNAKLSAVGILRKQMGDFPSHWGSNPSGTHSCSVLTGTPPNTTETAATVEYSHMTVLNYLSAAFAYFRGGLDWQHKLRVFGGLSSDNPGPYSFIEVDEGYSSAVVATGFDPVPYTTTKNNVNTLAQFMRKNRKIYSTNDGVLSVEYKGASGRAKRYLPARMNYLSSNGSNILYNHRMMHRVRAYTVNPQDCSPERITYVDDYVRAGKNFSLHWHIGPPILYRVTGIPEGYATSLVLV